ncbi:hypothetical protein AGOR_G00002030 [Albula goreensis]|uniref:Cadherin domain-containing protein n=1 Tax=Albula goreensis TaxID=1534307 RepID=A0A8T3E7U2_9TELE|nr:hypothetical protein AGOR_G00002030 [Albula goreensis]
MNLPVVKQVIGPSMWVGLWALALLISAVTAELRASSEALNHSPVRQRHKRVWLWKYFFLEEEKFNPPHYVGKLTSTKASNGTKFVIKGEGANSIFNVSTQGDIYALKTLDREVKSVYNLTAHLLNISTNMPVEDPDPFSINIIDLNDNIPVFPPSYNGSIPERSDPGAHVLTVSATDPDDPTTLNGQVEYKLLNRHDTFDIDRNGRITTKIGYLDREKQSKYIVIVHAKDMPGKRVGGSATTTVTITVSDVNDNMSTFKKKLFKFNVEEDKEEGFKIGTMEVEDKDERQNKDPVFSIAQATSSQPDFSSVFQIVRNQLGDGVLSLKQKLDFESRRTYSFNAVVREENLKRPPDDKGAEASTTAQVTINVLDVDEPPVFMEKAYRFKIREDAKVTTKVGSVQAMDPDAAQHSVRYSIRDSKCPVKIDSKTGEMYLDRKLDRETTPVHMFNVTAEEATPQALRSHVSISLVVLDVNDNAPELTNIQDLFACEKDERGTVIGTIGATDKDEHQQSFHFSLAKQSPKFSLTSHFGNATSIVVTEGVLTWMTGGSTCWR